MAKTLIAKDTQLTAPGNGTSVDIGARQPASITVEVTIASINTNVIVRVDHSDDAFSTSIKSPELTITANGTYTISGISAHYNSLRPVFVSESGGTAATVDFRVIMGY